MRITAAASIKDLNTLIKQAIRIDNRLYERAIEKKYDNNPRGFGRSHPP